MHSMAKVRFALAAGGWLATSCVIGAPASMPVVLELFTSQGCSSCPPADALLQRIAAEDSGVLALSFHVNYWDDLGWKDPYSLQASTDRQNDYARKLGLRQVFTPQLIVNGRDSMVGSDRDDVNAAIRADRGRPAAVAVSIGRVPGSGEWQAVLEPSSQAADPQPADVWLIVYQRHGRNAVPAGENRGRTLESINNVMATTRLGGWQGGKADFPLNAELGADQGIAVLVQQRETGRLLGAGVAAASPAKP